MIISIDQYLSDRAARQRHPHEISRVSKKISTIVFEFCRQHVGQEFHMCELEEFINRYTMTAPGSAGRILRLLDQAGTITYQLIERSKSLYRIINVNLNEDQNGKTTTTD